MSYVLVRLLLTANPIHASTRENSSTGWNYWRIQVWTAHHPVVRYNSNRLWSTSQRSTAVIGSIVSAAAPRSATRQPGVAVDAVAGGGCTGASADRQRGASVARPAVVAVDRREFLSRY